MIQELTPIRNLSMFKYQLQCDVFEEKNFCRLKEF